MGLTRLKLWYKVAILLEALGENPFLCHFQFLEAICMPWPKDPYSISKASRVASSNTSDYNLLPKALNLVQTPLHSPNKDYCDYIGLCQITQNNHPILRCLI